jgi:hypothetical protein
MMLLLNVLRLLWLILMLEEGDPPGDDDQDDDDNDTEEDDAPEPPTDEELKNNPRIKELSRENGKWRIKLRKAEERIEELEDGDGQASVLRTSCVEAAFWRSLVVGPHKIADHESALDLFTARGFADLVKIDENLEVSGMDDAIEKLVARYPWLADDDLPSDDDVDVPSRRTAPPPRKKMDTTQAKPSRKELEKRMPHLRKHAKAR